jgi:Cellulase (glycosyl hydrolase family 5)
MPARRATRRARLARGIVLAAMLGGTVALLALPSGKAFASKSQWSIFEDHPYLVATDPATRAKTLEEIKLLGADTLRIEVKWNEVAPAPYTTRRPVFDATNPSAYPGFAPYDDLVRTASAKGFRIIITVTGDAPLWATAGGRGGNYEPDAAEYGRFAAAVGARYSGSFSGVPKVVYFTIWNEPNHINFIKPIQRSPFVYRKLVDAGVPALRAKAAPEAKIFVGELKPTPAKGLGPKKFFQDWLCLDARYKKLRGSAARKKACSTFKKISADGFAHHPYGPTELKPRKQDILNLLVIRRLGKMLDLAAKARRLPRGLPIYNTEFGLQTNPPDVFVGTNPSRQAALINIKEEFSYRYSRLKSYSQYQLYDDPARSGPPAVKWSGFQTGLRFAGGRAKPSYDAYKFPLVVRKKRNKVVIWGRVRPGTGPRFVQLQHRRGAKFSNVGARIRTNALGYFTLKRPTGTYRFLAYGQEPATAGASAGLKLLGQSRVAKPALLD